MLRIVICFFLILDEHLSIILSLVIVEGEVPPFRGDHPQLHLYLAGCFPLILGYSALVSGCSLVKSAEIFNWCYLV